VTIHRNGGAVAESKSARYVKKPAKQRLPRAEKADRTKRLIFESAAEVVGEVGYAAASISEITRRAGLAQGTFYNYFASREELFGQLLPTLGEEMLDHIAHFVRGSKDIIEMEERGFRGFFHYLAINSAYLKILTEAETLVPAAYKIHFDTVAGRYVESLRRSKARGELTNFTDDELEVLAYILMAVRSHLARFGRKNASGQPLPEAIVRTYMKFVRAGIASGGAAAPRPGGKSKA
jgi:AcrR family transcriptional regulator